ncbi:uncharacterized protein LOC133174059 [Saccostrea echinata]|uniref:uncharacterized protein LOC133174059 n=1 Tax=Saccostrea echinata TaxID=191078 RepID=UPI002A80907F|nr:uncharacterized protein LOC133174059 [Saccostrea echinata]
MADHTGHTTDRNDEVRDRIQSNTLSIAPVDRETLRHLYNEQREDSFVHPEPVFPEEELPSYEEAVSRGYKGLKDSTEDASPTHAGEGNTSGPRETVFLGRDKSKLTRKKSKKKRSKSRDGEDSEIKMDPMDNVEMVPLRIEVKGDNSNHTWTEAVNGETEIGTTEGEDSSKKSKKKKKKKRFLEREASERDITEMSLAVQNQAEGIPDVELQDSPDQSQREEKTVEDGPLMLVSTNGEYSVIDEQAKKKSKKKKKRRDTSPDEMAGVEMAGGEKAGGETLDGEKESSWKKAKKKKKKKIREREVIEAMTGKELPEQENLPPQIPTAAYVETKTPCTSETNETRALPPLLLKRMSSLNKVHAEDSGPVDSIPDHLREDTTLVGRSLPPISSVMDKEDGEKPETEEGPGEKEPEDKNAKLKGPLLDKMKDLRSTHLKRLEEGNLLTEDRSEADDFECKRMCCLNSCCTVVGRFLIRFWRFLFRNRDWTSRESKCIIAITISVVAAIVFLGLFPSSFVYLDYHEYALKYNKVTGVVDRSTAYDFGCYILGPSTAFLTFSRSAHIITKSHEVFTVDKLSIKITYHLQYFLRRSEIGTLHREFGMGYDSVIRSITESRVKNSATSISVDYFRFQRAYLETYFHNKLKKRLEGDCCPSCCPTSCTNNTVCSTCLGPTTCNQGYHIYVVYFQLTKVDIPQEVLERFLTSVILQEQVFTEQLKQDKAVEDKITERQTSQARNQANEIKESGNAESEKIRVISEADREANLTTAYVGALSSMYTTLNITQEDHKLSILMMRVLKEAAVKGKLYRSYGYDNETIYNRPLALPAG